MMRSALLICVAGVAAVGSVFGASAAGYAACVGLPVVAAAAAMRRTP